MIRTLRVTGIVFAVLGLVLSIVGIVGAYSDDPGPWAGFGLGCVSVAVACALGAVIYERQDPDT